MGQNEFDLVCTSDELTPHKKSLDKAGINYTQSISEFYNESIRLELNSIDDLLNLIHALDEQLIFLNDGLIEIYDSHRE